MLKISLPLLINHDFDFTEVESLAAYYVNQQDNMLFRQIRLITGDCGKRNDYIIFVNCKTGKSHADEMNRLICEGFYVGSRHYVICERSASMTRTSILSFVDETINAELTERVTMGIHLKSTVLSKWYAYRGLMLSSCHCLEDWYPRIIIVPDYEKTIQNQKIKYVYDKEVELVNHDTGEPFTWKQKDIATGTRDIDINVFDGCGIHHPDITDAVRGMLDSKTDPTTILWRAPFIKGVTHEMDYTTFFAERGVTEITDVWGMKHDVSPTAPPAIIMCESMYKGKKYFKDTGTYADWERYWKLFRQYNHCIGIAKWNFSLDEEPVYTRANYQILQDLDLTFDEFAPLAAYSVHNMERILSGEPVALYAFLGLYADQHKGLNQYMEALLKDRRMIDEESVRNYIFSLIDKTIDEMKCGKLYLKACFKFIAPDLIMLMEHIGGLSPTGCLAADEFFTFNREGEFNGEYLIERNPHICRSEHVILNAVNNDLTNKYCRHLVNVCMVNGHSITPQRLNGCDFDGDLVFVTDNKIMMNGVHRDAPITIDIEDKITVLDEEDTLENRASMILRDHSNMIGEVSNYATAYHNKKPTSEKTRQQYESFVDLLSVINGKVIDSAKTGVVYNVPRYIAKYGRPLPYFMKYASDYYASMKHLSQANSNMNRLCWQLESWHQEQKGRKNKHKIRYHIAKELNLPEHFLQRNFDWTIMIDSSIPVDESKLDKLEVIYKKFLKENNKVVKEYRRALGLAASQSTTEYVDAPDWTAFYNSYRLQCLDVCPNPCELANLIVRVCYERHPKKNKKFIWIVGGEGILSNLKNVETALPMRDPNGEYEYLGNHYRMEQII